MGKKKMKIKSHNKISRNNEITEIKKKIVESKKDNSIDDVVINFYKEKSALDTFAIFYNVIVVVFVSTLLHGALDFYFSYKEFFYGIEINEPIVKFLNLYADIFVAIIAFFLVNSIRKRRKSNYLWEHCLKKDKQI